METCLVTKSGHWGKYVSFIRMFSRFYIVVHANEIVLQTCIALPRGTSQFSDAGNAYADVTR